MSNGVHPEESWASIPAFENLELLIGASVGLSEPSMREEVECMRLEVEDVREGIGVGRSSRCWRRRETSGMAPSVTAL